MPNTQPIPDELADLLGETIAGAYRLDEVIGSGGMGIVFGGVQLKLKRPIAVKVLDPQIADPVRGAQRFQREAESVARLDHPNCLQVYDYGTTDGGMHFMVMPRLTGRSLSQVLGQGNLPPRHALRLVNQVLAGLEHAHGQGVVHRDLKPANIFVVEADGDETVKIVDFGIAKIVDDDVDASFQTRTGVLFGTPAYMSPEQAVGEPIDARSDLYALGIVLYRMIFGDVPHRGSTVIDQMRKRATLTIPDLPAPCPAPISALIRWLCGRELEDRCPDAGAARSRVQELLADAPPSSPEWDEPLVPPTPFEAEGSTEVDHSLSVAALGASLSDTGHSSRIGSSRRRRADDSITDADAAPHTGTARLDPSLGADTLPPPTAAPTRAIEPASSRSTARARPVAFAAVAVAVVAVAGAWAWSETTTSDIPAQHGAAEAPTPSPVPSTPMVPSESDQPDAEPTPPATAEPDVLEKLTLVNHPEQAAALSFTRRHEILDELRADARARGLVDETANAILDLEQADQAPTPCETVAAALETLASARTPAGRRAIRRAKVPAGDEDACSEARRRLAELRRGREPSSAPPTGSPAGSEPPTASEPRPGDVTPKLGGLK